MGHEFLKMAHHEKIKRNYKELFILSPSQSFLQQMIVRQNAWPFTSDEDRYAEMARKVPWTTAGESEATYDPGQFIQKIKRKELMAWISRLRSPAVVR